MPPLLSHPGGGKRDELRLYVADIAPQGKRCALYGKALMRTATFVRLLALFSCFHAAAQSIHPMDFDFHPMESPIHPMEISIQGHFSAEK